MPDTFELSHEHHPLHLRHLAQSLYGPVLQAKKTGLMSPVAKPPFDENFNEEFRRFQQSYFEFWAKEFSIGNEKYLLDHPEIYGLIVVFIRELLKAKPQADVNAFAARHFTRPIKVLEQEVRKYLKLSPSEPYRTSQVPRSKMDIKTHPSETPSESALMSPERGPSLLSDVALRSSFLTLETSDTSLLSTQAVEDIGPATLEDHFDQWMDKIFETAFLRTVVSLDILIDGIYYIVQDCADHAVGIVLAGVVQDIGVLIYSAYSQFELRMENKKRMLNRQKDKTAMKAYRLRTGFRGNETALEDERASTALTITVSDIETVIEMRKSTYNRYEKDKFGVYTSNEMKKYVDSLTVAPRAEDIDGDEKSRRSTLKFRLP